MRIGILTFHRAHNYGAMLQAYGLLTYLKSLGHEVYVIDYCPKVLKKAYRRSLPILPRNPVTLFKKLIEEPFVHTDRKKRYDAFDEFMKTELNLFPWHDQFEGKEFDYIFIGSDQVWNRECLGRFDSFYWGEGIKCKVASYAASMAWYRPVEQELPIVKRCLNNLCSISVREKDAEEYLSTIIDKPVEVVCDPTLLLQKECWEKISNPNIDENKYVLCYDLVSNQMCQEFAEKLAKTKGLKLLNIVGNIKPKGPTNSLNTAGPREFLSYIRSAEYVVTTSFHGTVFSLIFNKQFYALGLSKFGGRIHTLLKTFDLEHRMKVPNKLDNLEFCDFSKVNKKLKTFVLSSKNYISKTLSE